MSSESNYDIIKEYAMSKGMPEDKAEEYVYFFVTLAAGF